MRRCRKEQEGQWRADRGKQVKRCRDEKRVFERRVRGRAGLGRVGRRSVWAAGSVMDETGMRRLGRGAGKVDEMQGGHCECVCGWVRPDKDE